MEALLVTDGEQVKAGQPIGVVGQEGNATGCHLHLEVHPTAGSIYEDDTDPAGWLREVGAYPSPL
jgi:murein DD-endopeptidase MepM/ murein hydrolase activator NlpD